MIWLAQTFDRIYHWALRQVDRMDVDEWVLAGIVLLVVAALCLRGFGSRSKY